MRQRHAILILWLLVIVFCVGLVVPVASAPGTLSDLLPWLRGDISLLPPDARWVWVYGLPRWVWVLPSILGVAAYLLGASILLKRDTGKGFPVRLMLWAFIGAVLLPLLLMSMEDNPLFLLFTRSASVVTGGYQPASTMIDSLSATLHNWPAFVERFRNTTNIYGGVALDPPGLEALYYGVTKLFSAFPSAADSFASLVRPLECENLTMMTWTAPQMASAWVQMAVPVWAALCVAPLYSVGRRVFGSDTARIAVALWPLVPGVAMFTPRFNAFYPLITIVMLSLLWRGRGWRIFVAGFVVSAGTFFNISLVPLGLLGGLTIIGCWLLDRKPISLLVRNLALFGLGSASVWLIYQVLSGTTLIDILSLSLSQHFQLNRPYLPWLVLHPYDMFMFTGLPLAALAIWAMVRIRQSVGRPAVFALAAGVTLLILTLSGTARGETGRVWLFFAPLWILLAASVVVHLQARHRAAIFVMQGLCLLCMMATLRVHFTTLLAPGTPTLPTEAAAIPVNEEFKRGNDAVTLVGFSAERVSPSTVDLDLHWRADSYVQRPYVLSLVPVPPDQSLRQSVNWDPVNWTYPPSCWLPGQEFVDTVAVPLGNNPPPGDWWFSVSISDVFTHDPMHVGDAIQQGIGPLAVLLTGKGDHPAQAESNHRQDAEEHHNGTDQRIRILAKVEDIAQQGG